MRTWAVVFVLVASFALACSGGGGSADPTVEPTSEPEAAPTDDNPYGPAQTAEANDDASLPGEFVDIQSIYNAAYGGDPNTAPHVQRPMDYANEQGLPPAGGPHWGSGPCPPDPADAPLYCGPVPWGIYRDTWPAESLVHNMEHGGLAIWYNTADQEVIDDLEQLALEYLNNQRLLVLLPYPDLDEEQVAITGWTRRDVFSTADYDRERLETFIETHERRINPEGF